jgi:hypothetical protein
MTINDPEVIAELRELYPRYENALVTNNVEKLVEMFWHDPRVMRFGAGENLYGYKEIDAFRKRVPPQILLEPSPGSTLSHSVRTLPASLWSSNAQRNTAVKVRRGCVSPKAGASSLRMFPL